MGCKETLNYPAQNSGISVAQQKGKHALHEEPVRTFIYDVLLWHGRRREIVWEAGGFSSYGYCLGSHILWPCKAHMDICSPLMTSGTYENKPKSLPQLPTIFPHQSPLLGNPLPIHLHMDEKEVRLSRRKGGGAIKAGKMENKSKNAFQKRTQHVSEANDTKQRYSGNLHRTQAIKEVDLFIIVHIYMSIQTQACGLRGNKR